jgi:hypothetical protein
MRSLIAAALMVALLPFNATAGTTGGLTGRVVDSTAQTPLAAVTVTASSPSQSATAISDASGSYRFLSLPPDTYTITFAKDGFDEISQPGVTILADQVQTVNVALVKTLKTIARVTSRAGGNLLKPGTTSDVYSVNATAAQAAASLAGPGGLSNAYGAIASVPGVAVEGGEAGWFQQVHIRGGDIDQVGYELDGIPVNRVYDNAPQTMLSTLGQQELQIYTGGTPASAEAQGIAGYVNQVIKTGTYPGFGLGNLSVGFPAFFHRASAEAGGSSPDRTFSYYIGLSGANQDYRYFDNDNGASVPFSFFYPLNAFDPSTFSPGPSGVYVLGNTIPNLFMGGHAYGIASTSQRDSVMNVHFAIPHKSSALRDDVQLLYLYSDVSAGYYSSANDIGRGNYAGSALVSPPTATQLFWNDGVVYTGPSFQPLNQANAVNYFFPSSPPHDFGSLLPATVRDTNSNGVGLTKAQYQHAFSDRAFLRAYAYTMYSYWFIHGPNSAAQIYGAELADYEIPDHTFGGNITFTDQISGQHLLSLAGSYTGANLQRYSNSFVRSNPNVGTLVDPATHICYDGTSAAVTSCYSSGASVGAATLQSSGVPALPAGAPAGAQWLASSGGVIANLNQVHSRFSAVNVTDEWRPNDRFVINGGVRVENFKYLLGDTSPNDPARQFWFNVYNKEHCFNPATELTPVVAPSVDAAGNGVCTGTGEQTLATLGGGFVLTNQSGGNISTTRWEPRLSFTYTLNPDRVIRGSYGVYARPQNTSWVQYNTVQSDLASFLGNHFYAYGFRTPEHDIRPDTSYNADLSFEQHLHGTDWSLKLTPFYRSTKDQLQNFFIDPLTGLESGLNVGRQQSYGVELAVQKGDFNRDGLSGSLAFTYTHSRIKYGDFSGTNRNVIDNLNQYISQYNSYTTIPCFASGAPVASPAACTAADIANPYFGKPAQPLLDRNGEYTTYDVIPGPFSAQNGYEIPYVTSLILNYKHQQFAITPSFTFSSGASYGAPLAWPGYSPETCTATLGAPTALGTPADPASCSANAATGLPLFIPDKYTGRFDNLGDFKQPWRFQMSVALSYDVSKHATAHLTLTSLIDHCGQRGYAWDQANVCVYGALPSSIFAPAGNFYPNSNGAAPPQMQFPYTFFLNNTNTGFVGTRLPLQGTFDVQFKL